MPYYSELGLTSTPSSSAYASLLLSGPYSNHSSIIASNYQPFAKTTSRHFRGGFKPHLTTISELNSPHRRIGASNYQIPFRPPIKTINTADIDLSLNKYKKFGRYERPKTETVERPKIETSPVIDKSPPSPQKTESPRSSQQEAKPNPTIRRERATVRLQTVHKDTLEKEIGAIRSWRDNFKPDELGEGETRKRKKTQGEILKEKFLIRSRSKENINKVELPPSRKRQSVRKSPSFHDICQAITSDNIEEELNPGQPVEVQRRQSRQLSSENIIKEIRRTSTDMSEEDIKILDALLHQEQMDQEPTEKQQYTSRSSVRKKKATRKKVDADTTPTDTDTESKETTTPARKNAQKRIKRTSSNSLDHAEADPLVKEIYNSTVREISECDIEQTKFKPKPIITASVGIIEEAQPNLKAVVDEVEVEESPKKTEKKFRFNVIVEVEDEDQTKTGEESPKNSIKPSFPKMYAQEGRVPSPKVRKPVITSILKKRTSVAKGQCLKEEKYAKKRSASKKSVKSTVDQVKTQAAAQEQNEVGSASSEINDNTSIKEEANLVIVEESKAVLSNVTPPHKDAKEGNTNDAITEKDDGFTCTLPNQVAATDSTINTLLKKGNNSAPDLLSEEVGTKDVSLKKDNSVPSLSKLEVTPAKSSVGQPWAKNLEKQRPVSNKGWQISKINRPVLNEPIDHKTAVTTTKSAIQVEEEVETDKRRGSVKAISANENTVEEVDTNTQAEPNLMEKEGGNSDDKNGKPEVDFNTGDVPIAANPNTEENESEKQRRLISKRSLVQKANKDDPDLEVFVPPEPEPEPGPPEEANKDAFVPLQSNRMTQWMHPWKKPEQFDVCPIEIYARPKVIRGRHYPRPRGHPAPPPPETESSSEDEEDESDESSEEETSSEEECDSGFGSKDKGSCESRDSPTTITPANNLAFSPDSCDLPDEISQSSTYSGFQKSGRITPPATTIPRFRKYCVDDFNFLKVLGKGTFGKVLLAELKGTEFYYAVKCLKKDVVLEDDDVECTLIERKVLALGTKHPYLCHLLCTFQTESHLFFVMEYLNGGDLMFHIQASGRFPEHQARFYAAEIVSGLKFLHNKGIVYRDLKLDNVLLDFDGHVRIADFGMCKLQIFLDRMAETFCGTPDYMAPEIIRGQHYNQNVDWWSFGVLLYEMLLGQSPFSGCDEDELFWSICNEKPVLPKYLSSEAMNVLTMLLEKDSTKRLGNRFCPNGDIQDHAFFRPIDWPALEARQLEPPFKPNLQHPLDTQYFDKHFTIGTAKLTPIDTTILQSMDQTQFQGFSYTNPNATDK